MRVEVSGKHKGSSDSLELSAIPYPPKFVQHLKPGREGQVDLSQDMPSGWFWKVMWCHWSE